MMMSKENICQDFIKLVQLGVGKDMSNLSNGVDWEEIHNLANMHNLTSVVLDGIERLPLEKRPAKHELLQWIGEVMQSEQQYGVQMKSSIKMALLLRNNLIRTYVLKGVVISECYPKPNHRVGGDMDCFLLPVKGDFDAWHLGNDLMKANGFEVRDNFYKHSKYILPGLTVESHQFMTPFRCNRPLTKMETVLQRMLNADKGEDRLMDSWLLRPPVMVSALFIVEHAYTHFLSEGLSWRHVLDWRMFAEAHRNDVDWMAFETSIDEFGLRRFFDSYNRLGRYLLGELTYEELTRCDLRMLDDVWADFDVVDNDRDLRGKISLAVKMWRARWKYSYFSEISMFRAMWIYVVGYLFVKNPKLR